MIESMHGRDWAKCTRRNCGWEGPLRTSHWAARDDEREHDLNAHGRVPLSTLRLADFMVDDE